MPAPGETVRTHRGCLGSIRWRSGKATAGWIRREFSGIEDKEYEDRIVIDNSYLDAVVQ